MSNAKLRIVTVCLVSGLIAACDIGSRAPLSPTSLGDTGPMPLITPQQAFAIEHALESCAGAVDLIGLLGNFFPGSIVSLSDTGSVLTFGVAAPAPNGHSSSHTIAYVDEDASGGLTCGDDVKQVDNVIVD